MDLPSKQGALAPCLDGSQTQATIEASDKMAGREIFA
jgi:hypothetical protein